MRFRASLNSASPGGLRNDPPLKPLGRPLCTPIGVPREPSIANSPRAKTRSAMTESVSPSKPSVCTLLWPSGALPSNLDLEMLPWLLPKPSWLASAYQQKEFPVTSRPGTLQIPHIRRNSLQQELLYGRPCQHLVSCRGMTVWLTSSGATGARLLRSPQ